LGLLERGLFIPFFAGTRVWMQSANQELYLLSHTSSPFCFGYFWDRVSLYAWPYLDHSPPICASLCSWVDKYMPPSSAMGSDGVLRTFHPGWLQTISLLSSASRAARIMDVSHHAWPFEKEFYMSEI
jgi:hypothetical protein